MKCTCITLYNYIVHCAIRPRAQLVKRYQGKRTSEKSEMLTYKDATQVFRYIYMLINKQRKLIQKLYFCYLQSRPTPFRTLTVWIISKQTQMLLIKQTN